MNETQTECLSLIHAETDSPVNEHTVQDRLGIQRHRQDSPAAPQKSVACGRF